MKIFNKLIDFLGGSKAVGAVTRSSDFILAIFITLIIMMIILPIPPTLLDNFIAINLTFSICLLMVSLYIPKAVNLSIFPSILLITTLFRLGIEISSTKQILLHAYAGHIIQAFGNFVVGGSFVVGIIVFLIITIVQFIVVTKGAERVAEVAARFNLDAMPGKQMSIDADMRSGVIDADQARQLRLALNKESQLYGAMDGSMKFVKGDVIASIVIAVINIVGGLIIGVTNYNMTLVRSAQIFTLLSIGSGLISQIPSLMISMTAGIVTTRVSSERKESNLGSEISTQLFRQPKAILIASVIIFALIFVKGFPKIIFLILAALLGSLGYMRYKKSKKLAESGVSLEEAEEAAIEGHKLIEGGAETYSLTLPVILEVGKSLSQMIKKEQKNQPLIEVMIPKMRDALYQDLGIRFPNVHVQTDAINLADDEYSILLNEVPLIRGKIFENHVLTNESPEKLRKYNIPFLTAKTTFWKQSIWVDKQYIDILKKAGIKFWTPIEVMVLHLSVFFRQYAGDFIGVQEVRGILNFVEKSYPELVKEITRLIPLQKLTEIFKRLVQEQISIKDLKTVMESLSEWAQTEKDTIMLTEAARSSLKRYISYKYSQGQSVLAAYLLDPEIEDIVRSAIKQTSAGSYLALDPDSSQMILQAMRNTIEPSPPEGQTPVLITAIDVRRFVKKLIEGEFPEVAVVSYQEIVPEIKIQPLGRVQL